MDACLSCLGLNRGSKGRNAEHPETSRLLYDDPYRSQYGSTGQRSQQQPDPEILRREREEMEGICHRMSDQVIDVFSVAPQESSRSSSQDHVKAMLNKSGVDPARLSEREWLALSLQSPAEQRKLIRAYAKTMPKQTQEDEMPPQISKGSRDGADATEAERVPSQEEMIYRTIRRNGKEPISIILDERESAAAQAAMG